MMTRRLWILLGIAVYLVVLFSIHRVRRSAARRRGPAPEKLQIFDHRGFLDELEEIYVAGLPATERDPDDGEGEIAAADPLPPGLAERLGDPPSWFEPAVWRGDLPEALPEEVRDASALIMKGEEREVDRLVHPAQEPMVDQAFASLGVHLFLERLYGGDLEGARSIIEKLPLWTRDRIGRKVVYKHLAHLALLEAEIGSAPKKRLRDAKKLIRMAGGGGKYADTGTIALWAHLWLTHGLPFLLEDLLLIRVDYSVRRGLAENRSSKMLYYELAHCCLLRGKLQEVADHLARALYFSSGGDFYAKPILEWPELSRMKPALVKQARARVQSAGGSPRTRAS